MATRRLNPKLLAAFEQAGIEPLEMDSPGRIVEVPVPPEQMQAPQQAQSVAPSSRFEMVRDYLERSRQPVTQPNIPEPDIAAARDQDAYQDFGAGMLAAGQAFTGNRRAVAQLPQTNANETRALGQQDARRRALAEWAQAQERQRLGETGLLGQAMSADEAAKARAESLGVQKERVALDRDKMTTEDENKDLDRDAKARARAAAAEAARKKAEEKAGAKGAKASGDLRKEFDALPEVKEYKGVYGAFEKVNLAAKANEGEGTPAGDLALIYAFNKILDYGSAVKEAEFANAQAAGSMAQKAEAAIGQVKGGTRLTKEQRADFVAQAKNVAMAGRSLYGKAVQRYQALAEKQGLAPEDVAQDVGEVGATPEKPEKPPEGKVEVIDPETGAKLFLSPKAAERLKAKAKP